MSSVELADTYAEFARVADTLLAARLPSSAESPAQELVARHQALWAELTELGWFDLLLPEEHDGLDLPPSVLGAMFVAMGRHLAPGPLAANMFTVPWLLAHPEVQSGALLAARAAGGKFAIGDEAAGGWAERASVLTLADGRLTGTLRAVPNAPDATDLVLVAHGPAGPSIVVVPARGDHITITPRVAIDPCESFGTIELDGFPIGDEQILASGEGAAQILEGLRAWNRILLACEMSGLVSRVLEMTVEYAKERKQFGRPIGANQAVKHLLASLACDADMLANLTRLTLLEADEASSPALVHSALLAKAFASRAAVEACEKALQAHGGIGFTAEYDLHWYFKRAITIAGRYGMASELNLELGRAALAPVPAGAVAG